MLVEERGTFLVLTRENCTWDAFRLKGFIVMTNLLHATWTRLRTNMRDPKLRRNVAFSMGGKLLGMALVLTAMYTFLPEVAHALGKNTTADVPTINAVNTVWTL